MDVHSRVKIEEIDVIFAKPRRMETEIEGRGYCPAGVEIRAVPDYRYRMSVDQSNTQHVR